RRRGASGRNGGRRGERRQDGSRGERAGRPERSERSDRPERAERADRAERAEGRPSSRRERTATESAPASQTDTPVAEVQGDAGEPRRGRSRRGRGRNRAEESTIQQAETIDAQTGEMTATQADETADVQAPVQVRHGSNNPYGLPDAPQSLSAEPQDDDDAVAGPAVDAEADTDLD
ncbi:MAG: hypothetical protein ACO2ER_16555, partial [Castellaniella sp.]